MLRPLQWRHTPHHILARAQLLIIPLPQLNHPAFPVQLLPNLLIGTHKLVDLSRQLVILVRHHPNVVVHRVDLYL